MRRILLATAAVLVFGVGSAMAGDWGPNYRNAVERREYRPPFYGDAYRYPPMVRERERFHDIRQDHRLEHGAYLPYARPYTDRYERGSRPSGLWFSIPGLSLHLGR